MGTIGEKDKKFQKDNKRTYLMKEDCPLRSTNITQHEFRPTGLWEFNREACGSESKKGKDTKKVEKPVSNFKTDIGLSGVFNMDKSLSYEMSFPELPLFLPIGFSPPEKGMTPVKKEGTQKEHNHENSCPKEERIFFSIAQIRMGDIFCKV